MSKSGGVFQFFGGRMTSRRQCPRGGVLVNVQEWGCFSIFRRADDVTQTMSKGGVLVECLHPPPLQERGGDIYLYPCIRACYLCKISGKSTPLPPLTKAFPYAYGCTCMGGGRRGPPPTHTTYTGRPKLK